MQLRDYNGITIDLDHDKELSEFALDLLSKYYQISGEVSPQESFARAALAYCAGDLELAQRIYNYAAKGWFMYSSPILSNAPKFGEKSKSLPISCFLNFVDDTLEGLIDHTSELRWLSVKGGGVGGHWSSVRSVSNIAPGPIPFLKTVDADMTAYRQGTCYSGDTEILTTRGWIKFTELLNDDEVAQVDDNRNITFIKPLELVKEFYQGKLLNINDGRNIDFMVTPNHSMVIDRKTRNLSQKKYSWNNRLEKIRADLLPTHNEVRMFKSGYINNLDSVKLNNSEKLMVAYQADGSSFNNHSITFHLKKERKIQRLLNLLQSTNWSYNLLRRKDGTTDIRIKVDQAPVIEVPNFEPNKNFDWVKPHTRSLTWLESFLEEVSYWDSSYRTEESFTYYNVVKEAAEIVFTAASLVGKSPRILEYDRSSEFKNNLWTVRVYNKSDFTNQKIIINEKDFSGFVYCAIVPTGKILVRRNGRSLICGNTRKGSYAAYLDISHPDVEEFLNIRLPTGGDQNRKCFNLHNAVNITDKFMEAVVENQFWNLIDPNDQTIRGTVSARELWQRILEIRFRTGEPYLNFIDEANRNLPEPLKKLGLKIHGSNLCSEIHLPTSRERTAVCCLSSLNLELYDQWKNTTIVRDLIRFLDNVLQFFIDNAPETLSRAKYSALRERSLGLGTMGFHAYLQSKMIPWDSSLAKIINLQIFSFIKEQAVLETELLATERGEYPDGIGFGKRNSHLLAIAPNANSSIIVSTSPSIEPWKSNAYAHRTRAGSFLVKNRYLEQVLQSHLNEINQTTTLDEIWSSIITNAGSVQHLDFLTEEEKSVFKTAFEIDQNWVVAHAADRQPYICQGQSVNLFFPAFSDKAYVNQVHLKAWKGKLKSLYYLRTEAGITADKVSIKVKREALVDYASKENDECIACQG